MMGWIKDLRDKRKINKEVKVLRTDTGLMLKDIKLMGKELEILRGVISQQNIGLNQAYANSREMYFGPNEFLLSPNQSSWKGVKVTLGGEDISDKISKLVIFGPSFIEG